MPFSREFLISTIVMTSVGNSILAKLSCVLFFVQILIGLSSEFIFKSIIYNRYSNDGLIVLSFHNNFINNYYNCLLVDSVHLNFPEYAIPCMPNTSAPHSSFSPVKESFDEDDKITVTCDQGYQPASTNLTCLKNGSWDIIHWPYCLQISE